MYIDRLLYPIGTLGPGKRIVLWTQGCSHHCYHCANPELWETSSDNWVNAVEFARVIRKRFQGIAVDGLTVTGGDPMEQFEELMSFLGEMRLWISDILVYTGFTTCELKSRLNEEQWNRAQRLIDVLIDGPYIERFNDNRIPLRGSTNQGIQYWNPSLQDKYETEMATSGRLIQNVFFNHSFISVGIHNVEGAATDAI